MNRPKYNWQRQQTMGGLPEGDYWEVKEGDYRMLYIHTSHDGRWYGSCLNGLCEEWRSKENCTLEQMQRVLEDNLETTAAYLQAFINKHKEVNHGQG